MSVSLLPDDVRRIAEMPDPVIRNLQITQGYHELAVAMGRWLPGGLNWCTVATWASRQAGYSIRREDLRRALQRLLRESAEAEEAIEVMAAEGASLRGDSLESLAGAIAAIRDALSPAAAFERTADAVARGNRKVFEEIGLEFARFLALFNGGPPAPAAFAAFHDSLRAGEPPDGQQYLRQAFSHYFIALSESDDKARAEWMHLANLEIGLHEQIRLNPEIREAMDAPVYDPAELRRRLLDELLPDPASRLRLAADRLLGRAGHILAARDRVADEVERIGRLIITETLMTLELPDGRTLWLGDELRAAFPATLQTLDNDDLLRLLSHIGSRPHASRGATDWGDLPTRMRYIAALFRAYHEDGSLFSPPFTAAQTALLKAGHLPDDLI